MNWYRRQKQSQSAPPAWMVPQEEKGGGYEFDSEQFEDFKNETLGMLEYYEGLNSHDLPSYVEQELVNAFERNMDPGEVYPILLSKIQENDPQLLKNDEALNA